MSLTAPDFPALPEVRRCCRLVTRTVPEITLAGHRLLVHDVRPNFIQAGRAVKEHVHSFYEGHILLTGAGCYLTGESQAMTPGGTLLHAPHAAHAWQESTVPCLRLLIWFSIEPGVPVPRPALWPSWPDLLWDIALLLNDAGASTPGWDARVQARLTVILSRLLTIADWPPTAEHVTSPQPLVALVDQFLRDNLQEPLTLQDIADHAGLSQRTLCRQFSDGTGTTVMERLANLRMDRAAALLAETDAPLWEVGADVGMPDPSYFCRRFRKHFHLTPNTYRDQVRAG